LVVTSIGVLISKILSTIENLAFEVSATSFT
jgi:hypothetical protein